MSGQERRLDLFAGTLRLAFSDEGEGRPFVLLHGGAGPASMMGLAHALAQHRRTIVPTHPGFDGQPRPDRFARVEDLVLGYLALLDGLKLEDVVVVGNSVGGWLAAELALRASPRIVGAVLLNAVGIAGSIADPAKFSPPELRARAFHDPSKFAAPLSAEATALLAENQRVLRIYAGEPFMHDPTLRARLASMSVPTVVVWGESDRICDVDYGRSYSASIPGSRFELMPMAGHFPQIERLEETRRLIENFAEPLEGR
jgi:pimeloyl-ACP methyl ester carboxylesterase